MAETEPKEERLEYGEETEDEISGEVEEETDEMDEEEDEEEEEEEEKDEPVKPAKPVKKRRCLRRKKIRQICFDDDQDEYEDQDEEGELFYKGEDEDEDEEDEYREEEEEESDAESYISSVLSAISFVWENEVYEFEELCDSGNIETVDQKSYVRRTLFDDTGTTRYLEVCRALNISPMLRVLHSISQEVLDLSYRNIDGKSIRAMCAALESNSFVRSLIMRYNKLEADDCHYIGLVLECNGKLSKLDFTGCRIGPDGLEQLIEHLPKNEVVTDLNLSKCNIQDEGMKFLAYVLTRNNSIQNLDLSYNKLGEESAEALATAFKLNNSVTTLILRYNNLFDPAAMKGFFRSLTANNSISHLDLSWNGLSGVEMGSNIGSYLKKNGTIQYLDLSDNRFEGLAVAGIKKGLAKSKNLNTLKLGKNPMSPEDLEMLLNGAKGSASLKTLDLDDLWVKKSFVKALKKVQQERDIEVTFAGMLGDYEVLGPDYPKVILQRAQFEAQKPKKAKKRKDFGHLMWTLGDEPLTQDEFMARVKKFKAKVNKELYPELIKQFLIPKVQLIDVVAMRKKYLSIFPDSTPPPPPKSKKGAKNKEVPDVQEQVEEEPGEPTGEIGAEEEEEEEEGDSEEVLGEEEDEEELVIEAGEYGEVEPEMSEDIFREDKLEDEDGEEEEEETAEEEI